MDRKFICDECSNVYSSRQSRWRHKKNDHAKSVPYCSYTAQRPTVKGGNLENLLQSPQDENEDEEKPRTKADIEKLFQKILQSLDKDAGEKVEEVKTTEDVENEIFEYVTREEKIRFYRLLDKLKLRKSHLKSEEFEKIERILPQYSRRSMNMECIKMEHG